MLLKRLRFYIIVGLIGAGSLVYLSLRSFSQTKALSVDSPASVYEHPLVPQVLDSAAPQISAASYILVDNDTNTVLISKNPKGRIYPASTTKLATAITALNAYPLDNVISVGSTYSEGKIMNLVLGENISVRSLINALLVYSANDAAYSLAEHHENGSSGFVTEMNALMKKYGLINTHFVNFDGIHSPDHYSTVSDLSMLARVAIKNPVIREVVKKKKLTITDTAGSIRHDIESTNELLDIIPEVEGLKTGWTPEAGGCFVSLLKVDGHELIGVVAASPDRFADTLQLLNWAKESVVWVPYKP